MLKKFKISIDTAGINDINEASKWYEEKQIGLGKKFTSEIKKEINSLKANPFIHAIRYKNIHCLVVRKFPYMIHFKINEQDLRVIVYAVFHTSRNPDIWER